MKKRPVQRGERPPEDPVEAAFRVIELMAEERPPGRDRQVFTLQVPKCPPPESAE